MKRLWLVPLCLLPLLGALAFCLRAGGSRPGPRAASALCVPDPPTGEFEPAVREILAKARKHLLANAGLADSWGWYAAVLDAHQLYAEAEPCYRRAHELAPHDARYSYNLAILLEQLGALPDESLALLRRVAQDQPSFPPVHVRIAHNLARKGELEAALASYQTALALDPALWIARRALGRLWVELGQFEKAVAELERVAAAAGEDGPTQAALAQAYAGEGERERAAAADARARKQADRLSLPDPLQFQVVAQGRSSRLASERARTRASDGDWAGVVEDLKLVLRTRPGDAAVHERLAEAWLHLGRQDLAASEQAESRRLRR